MSLKLLLSEYRAAVCEAWLDRALAIYSNEYGGFVRGRQNPFANPVGAILKEGLASLFDALVDGADAERCRAALTPVIRIRAVQDAPPSQALAFVPLLKDVVRKILHKEMQDEKTREAVSDFEARIDQAALLAFDIYSECREKIFELRVNELKRNTVRLLSRPGAPAASSDEKAIQPRCRAARESEKGHCQ